MIDCRHSRQNSSAFGGAAFCVGRHPVSVGGQGAATSTIPIVFSAFTDPVRNGLVTSLARPGGNATGMSLPTSGLIAKNVKIMKDVMPTASVVALLINPSRPDAAFLTQEAQTAASTLGIKIPVLNASADQGLEAAFTKLATLRASALVVHGAPFFETGREKIVALSAKQRIPAAYAWGDNVLAGGLLSCGPSLTDAYRQAATYAGRILKGERPADLPVQEPRTFELAINLKTTKALGLAVPPWIVARADEVIE
jgi:ABC-type uncharacterized transport system substrate-binding protein